MHAVICRIGREPQIGDDEPLGRQRIIGLGRAADRQGRHEINTRRKVAHGLVDRECRRDLGVELLLDLELAFPHARPALAGDTLELIGTQIAMEIVADDGVEQIAVADPVDRDLYRSRVDADDWNAALAGTWQHIGFADEAGEG